MIWAFLALIGIPLWLVAGGLFWTLWHRRSVVHTADVFACKARASSGDVAGLGKKFPRVSKYSWWVQTVLVVHTGASLNRSHLFPVAAAVGPLAAADTDGVRRLGDKPQLLTLRLDDGGVIEIAAAQGDSQLLLGPFADGSPSRA